MGVDTSATVSVQQFYRPHWVLSIVFLGLEPYPYYSKCPYGWENLVFHGTYYTSHFSHGLRRLTGEKLGAPPPSPTPKALQGVMSTRYQSNMLRTIPAYIRILLGQAGLQPQTKESIQLRGGPQACCWLMRRQRQR